MSLTHSEWGVTVEGYGHLPYDHTDNPELAKTVKRYTLVNDKGMRVQVMNYGVTITSVQVPDRRGVFDDVLLGFDHLDDYIHHEGLYLGSTIGRVSDRISSGRFQQEGRMHDLTRNLWNKLHLHGGVQGFSQVVWNSRIQGEMVVFTHMSPHLDEGYPGNLLTTVKMWLNQDNSLKMTIEATTDISTPVSITNHACFNLAGHRAGRKALEEHVVVMNADRYLVTDNRSLPTGEIRHVGCTLLDLRIHRLLSKLLPQLPGGGFEHNYCVNGTRDDGVRFVARLLHPRSGRVLEVFSNEPTVHFQTSFIDQEEPVDDVVKDIVEEVLDGVGDQLAAKAEQLEVEVDDHSLVEDFIASITNEVDESGEEAGMEQGDVVKEEQVETEVEADVCDGEVRKRESKVMGKGGAFYEPFSCFSLMPQAYADAVNKRNFPEVTLHPGDTYNHTIIYKFTTVRKTKKVVQEADDNTPALPPLSPEPSRHPSQEDGGGKSPGSGRSPRRSNESGAGSKTHRVHGKDSENTFNFSRDKLPPVYPPFE